MNGFVGLASLTTVSQSSGTNAWAVFILFSIWVKSLLTGIVNLL